MNTLFWLLWSIDLLLTFIIILAGMVRENMGAFNNETFIYGVVLLLVLLGSIIVRYVLHWPLFSIGVAALPWLIIAYLYFRDTYR